MLGVDGADFEGEGALGGGYIGGGPLGGGDGDSGADKGGAVGIGVDGDGNTLCWLGFGGLSLGSGGGGGKSLIAPICLTCSRGGNLVTKLGKSIASKVSRACSRAAASG